MNHAPGAGLIARPVASSPARYHCTMDTPTSCDETFKCNVLLIRTHFRVSATLLLFWSMKLARRRKETYDMQILIMIVSLIIIITLIIIIKITMMMIMIMVVVMMICN